MAPTGTSKTRGCPLLGLVSPDQKVQVVRGQLMAVPKARTVSVARQDAVLQWMNHDLEQRRIVEQKEFVMQEMSECATAADTCFAICSKHKII